MIFESFKCQDSVRARAALQGSIKNNNNFEQTLFLSEIINGTGGRTRTATLLPELDFESNVSTNFTTPA
jgi:hypothetical protein